MASAGSLQLVLSRRLLAELDDVLHREKFEGYGPSGLLSEFVDWLATAGQLTDDPTDVPQISPDPDDDYLIALARAADADALVSGDRDLLDLALPDVRVLTPRQLLEEHQAP